MLFVSSSIFIRADEVVFCCFYQMVDGELLSKHHTLYIDKIGWLELHNKKLNDNDALYKTQLKQFGAEGFIEVLSKDKRKEEMNSVTYWCYKKNGNWLVRDKKNNVKTKCDFIEDFLKKAQPDKVSPKTSLKKHQYIGTAT